MRLDELVAHWGYVAIAVIVLLGNVGLPVPEETILALGGFLAWQGQLRLSVVVLVGIVSAVVGDNIGYWLGRRHGAKAIDHYAVQWLGRPDLVTRTQRLVAQRGMLAVFVARFVPGLRFIAGPLAGATGLPLRDFAIANVLGAAVYVPLATAAGWAVGYGMGDYIERLRHVVGAIEHVVIGAIVLAVVGTLGWRMVRTWWGPRS